MPTRRDFLRYCGISIGVSLLDSLLPINLHDDNNLDTLDLIYMGDLHDLYNAQALALLGSNPEDAKILGGLVTTLEDETRIVNTLSASKNDILEISIAKSKEFRKKKATRDEHKELIEHTSYKSRQINDMLRNETKFFIYRIREGIFIAYKYDRQQISESEVKTLEAYKDPLSSFNRTKSIDDKLKRSVTYTIQNSSPDIGDIYSAANDETHFKVLMGLATIESLGNPYLVGLAGEVGRFQIKPEIARRIMAQDERFEFSSEDEMLARLVIDTRMSAIMASIILNDVPLDYPEKVYGYNVGVKMARRGKVEDLREHWYVKKFENAFGILDRKEYLS